MQAVGGWAIHAHHTDPMFQESLPDYYLYGQEPVPLLFTENETNNLRINGGQSAGPFVKDGINNFVVHGQTDAVNQASVGTKAAAHYQLTVGSGEMEILYLRLARASPAELDNPFEDFETIFQTRLQEADEFYQSVTPPAVSPEEAKVMRQALAGMLWSKQYYYFDVGKWLKEHGVDPWASQPKQIRNREWFHMQNDHIISMPDKWEYPWYAAWDLAFHAIALSVVDPDFAKQQLDLIEEIYLHPNGQILPMNGISAMPTSSRWAASSVPNRTSLTGTGDIAFLKRIFGKLMMTLPGG
jgi:hypothetical protein